MIYVLVLTLASCGLGLWLTLGMPRDFDREQRKR